MSFLRTGPEHSRKIEEWFTEHTKKILIKSGDCPVLHSDCRLNWKEHIGKKNRLKKKTDQLVHSKIKSHLSIENKLLIYKAVIKPIWNYGIELWGCASKSNTVIIQRPQSKILRTIANAPRHVTNHNLHTDFNIPYVTSSMKETINITTNRKPIPIHYYSHHYNL